MVRLDRITTRGGDGGMTSLGGGSRVAKASLRIQALGALDELNAAVGFACVAMEAASHAPLRQVQQELFDLGADVSQPAEATGKLRVTEAYTERLEQAGQRINAGLPPLQSFILPGSDEREARLHLARAQARRAERAVWRLAEAETLNPEVGRYLNRLSDYLFILARACGTAEACLWIPGAHHVRDA